MTDERPRPEFGEYASPEEQLARMGERMDAAPQPAPSLEPPAALGPPAPPALPAPPAPGSLGPLPLLDQAPPDSLPLGLRRFGGGDTTAGAGGPGGFGGLGFAAPAPATGIAPPARTAGAVLVDRIITIALLAYGLLSVLTGIPQYLDLATIANQSFAAAGVPGEFTNFAQGDALGATAAFILAIGFALTALIAVRRLRRRRVAWWIPIAGAVLTFIPIAICLAIALMGDPAFIDYVASQSAR